jgi:hypothetical protein
MSITILTTEQLQAASDKLEALTPNQAATTLRTLRTEHLYAVDLEMGGRETATGRAAHALVEAEMARRAETPEWAPATADDAGRAR